MSDSQRCIGQPFIASAQPQKNGTKRAREEHALEQSQFHKRVCVEGCKETPSLSYATFPAQSQAASDSSTSTASPPQLTEAEMAAREAKMAANDVLLHQQVGNFAGLEQEDRACFKAPRTKKGYRADKERKRLAANKELQAEKAAKAEAKEEAKAAREAAKKADAEAKAEHKARTKAAKQDAKKGKSKAKSATPVVLEASETASAPCRQGESPTRARTPSMTTTSATTSELGSSPPSSFTSSVTTGDEDENGDFEWEDVPNLALASSTSLERPSAAALSPVQTATVSSPVPTTPATAELASTEKARPVAKPSPVQTTAQMPEKMIIDLTDDD